MTDSDGGFDMESLFMHYKKYFGEQLPMNVRFFNFACFGGMISSLLATLINVIMQNGFWGILTCCLCTLGFLFDFVLAQLTEKFNFVIILTIFFMNFVFFPALYITLGGISSGMPVYFAIGFIFTVLMMKPKLASFFLVAEVVWYTLLLHFDKLHPQYAAYFITMGNKQYTDTTLDMLLVSLCLAAMVKILALCFEYQQNKTDRLLKQMEELAVKDPLTGAYNRRFLLKYMDSAFENCKRDGTKLAVVMFDIDKFKRVNDDYGHLVGDDVIKALSSALMQSCREYDIVARYGGEEFVLVMPGATSQIAWDRAEDIRKTFAGLKINDAIERTVTISGGVAEYDSSLRDSEKLISKADDNLYIAKESGRNRIIQEDGKKDEKT